MSLCANLSDSKWSTIDELKFLNTNHYKCYATNESETFGCECSRVICMDSVARAAVTH